MWSNRWQAGAEVMIRVDTKDEWGISSTRKAEHGTTATTGTLRTTVEGMESDANVMSELGIDISDDDDDQVTTSKSRARRPYIRQTSATILSFSRSPPPCRLILSSLKRARFGLRRDCHRLFSPAEAHPSSIEASLTLPKARRPKYRPTEALLAHRRLIEGSTELLRRLRPHRRLIGG
ncbi:hypothetical protein Acr_11g0008420 [Actinidia rufa]|uniref:Uncharacterized protein n=1 Tax=Actinidia rufa TaxID=165716 RepID=A0A7J0FDP9_9ERIC|nr:hypothetical protein Acr_11g0008420 [Actinidia rufa]